MIVGRMYTLGLVNEETTLGEIFNQTLDWVNVTQASEKQEITLRALISFTSGLKEKGLLLLGFNNANEMLNSLDFDPTLINVVSIRERTYLDTSSIISWVILRTTGQSPLEYANSQGIFSRLGINATEEL
jgi:hypothetical protein